MDDNTPADDFRVRSSAEIGLALRRARESKAISLRSLARRIGVSPATLSAVETGKTDVTFSRTQRIAAALGVTPGQLLVDLPYPPGPDFARNAILTGGDVTGPAPGQDWREFPPIEI